LDALGARLFAVILSLRRTSDLCLSSPTRRQMSEEIGSSEATCRHQHLSRRLGGSSFLRMTM